MAFLVTAYSSIPPCRQNQRFRVRKELSTPSFDLLTSTPMHRLRAVLQFICHTRIIFDATCRACISPQRGVCAVLNATRIVRHSRFNLHCPAAETLVQFGALGSGQKAMFAVTLSTLSGSADTAVSHLESNLFSDPFPPGVSFRAVVHVRQRIATARLDALCCRSFSSGPVDES
jgi:hypothetical protein